MIKIKVIPKAKNNSVTEENGLIKVHVTKPAENNKANEEVIKVLSKHFNVKKNAIVIVKGRTSRNKIINILKC